MQDTMSESHNLETFPSDSKLSNEKICGASDTLERTRLDKLIDDRKGNNKETNIKYSQRSMRRGSGAGSPNSQLCIPRYPAFDFSEQEDVNSMFPSPSEPEANRNSKIDSLQEVPKLEATADSDATQNSVHLKDKNRNSSKSKTLMPEHMENSETESTKGSFEYEVPDLPSSADATSIPVPDIAFPSLPNTFLAKLGVHKDSPLP
ncbi:uncharacterized protein TNIN_108341 [Trichonephila inaurata madagascariensis]|nr:uncharacterized protein TNIN_108341 [Trichonephila inaurata madagascariensis]